VTPAEGETGGSFRMPAEWEPHEATWIGWPHNRSDWPGKFAAIPWVYGEIVRKISAGEDVRILVASKPHETKAVRLLSRVGVDPSRVSFFRFPTDRGWTRDFGPIFVRRERPRREVAVAGFGFNAWARYPDWRKDAGIAARAAKALGVKFLPVRFRGKRVVLEGGAIEVNGRGTLIATEECLLDPEVQVRNPGMGREGLEEVFRAFLGVTNVIWLGKGIAGDDTHGHVDDLCRFTGPRTVVLCRESDPKDENHRLLEENRERLASARLEDGSRPEVVALLVAGGCMAAAHGALYGFFSLHAQAVGYSKTAIGAFWVVSVALEIAFFLTQGKWFARFGVFPLMTFAFGVAAVRFLLIAELATVWWILVFAQAMHAVTFAVHHSASVLTIQRWFPGRAAARGQALYISMAYGLGGTVGSLVAAWLWSAAGASWAFVAGSAGAILGFWTAVRMRRADRDRAKPHTVNIELDGSVKG